ncbi:hypothetical protein [Nocardia sp. NPDC002869]|uniref:hypothetical protein n=1 Tax=Nocardia sp. NPDC002869 TaxID=3161032 RepID=UPI00398CC1DF
MGDVALTQARTYGGNDRITDIAALERVAEAIRCLPLEPGRRGRTVDYHDSMRLQSEIDRVIDRWREIHSNEVRRER